MERSGSGRFVDKQPNRGIAFICSPTFWEREKCMEFPKKLAEVESHTKSINELVRGGARARKRRSKQENKSTTRGVMFSMEQ